MAIAAPVESACLWIRGHSYDVVGFSLSRCIPTDRVQSAIDWNIVADYSQRFFSAIALVLDTVIVGKILWLILKISLKRSAG